jgi:hypothetical protein
MNTNDTCMIQEWLKTIHDSFRIRDFNIPGKSLQHFQEWNKL